MQFINSLLLLNAVMLGAAEEPAVPSEPEVVEPTTPEEKDDGFITLEDKDKNGIPDNLEEYYKKNIQDQWMFGISLGSLIGFGISALGLVYNRMKDKKHQKKVEANSETNAKYIEELKAKEEEREKMFAEYKAKTEAVLLEYKQLTTQQVEALKKATLQLGKYAEIDEKLNATLDSVGALSRSQDYMVQGITKEVNDIIKEVR